VGITFGVSFCHGRAFTWHPELPVVGELFSSIPTEWSDVCVEHLTTGDPAVDCALFQILTAIFGRPAATHWFTSTL
jgi:hypothetical protein